MATNNRFREVYRPTRALTAALHARDEHTRHHCDRVADIAVRIAKAMCLDNAALYLVEVSARLHDIGKIGIPDSVLLKPTRFNEEEWRVMKTHAEIGERIIDAMELPDARSLAKIVRHHHENFDGDGYPDALKGDAIPLESRILLIADTYDAMRSHRPNSPSMSHREAVSIMDSESGWKFDPAIFRHFPAIAVSRR